MKPLRSFRRAIREGALVLGGVRLLTAAADADRLTLVSASGTPFEAVWIQVAREGTFKGHQSGKAFTLDAAAFEQLIKNFRRHPSYVANDNGIGIADVIAYDFHHESEKQGTPAVAVVGAPAQAWALDLQTRTGEGGELQLWALTRYLEPARTYVLEGRYHWTSVAVWQNAPDPVSGESMGWYLSSIAFTNDPFIQGMEPIAAARGAELRRDDDDSIVHELRWMFGLPEVAGLPEIGDSVSKLRGYALADQPAPAGVDVEGLVGRLRNLLNLPLLTPDAEVFSQAEQLLAKLNATTPQPTAPTAAPPPAITATRQHEDENEMHPKLLALAGRLGVKDESPEALAAAVSLLLENDSNMRAKFSAMAKVLGVENSDDLIAEFTKRMAEIDELRAALPELESLRAQQGEDEEDDVEQDVMAAMRVHDLGDQYKPLLMHMRTGGVELPRKRSRDGSETIDAKHPKLAECLERRREAKKLFAKSYPVPSDGTEYLLEPAATNAPRAPFASPLLNGLKLSNGELRSKTPQLPPPGPRASREGLIDLSRMPGRNVTEQAMAYVRSQPGGDRMTFEDAHAAACAIVDAQRAAASA